VAWGATRGGGGGKPQSAHRLLPTADARRWSLNLGAVCYICCLQFATTGLNDNAECGPASCVRTESLFAHQPSCVYCGGGGVFVWYAHGEREGLSKTRTKTKQHRQETRRTETQHANTKRPCTALQPIRPDNGVHMQRNVLAGSTGGNARLASACLGSVLLVARRRRETQPQQQLQRQAPWGARVGEEQGKTSDRIPPVG
jgi:hypothetical protein